MNCTHEDRFNDTIDVFLDSSLVKDVLQDSCCKRFLISSRVDWKSTLNRYSHQWGLEWLELMECVQRHLWSHPSQGLWWSATKIFRTLLSWQWLRQNNKCIWYMTRITKISEEDICWGGSCCPDASEYIGCFPYNGDIWQTRVEVINFFS